MLDMSHERPVEPSLESWRPAASEPPSLVGPRSIWRRRTSVLAFGLAFLLLGLAAGFLRPPAYTAASQVLVYSNQIQPGADTVVLPGTADVALVHNQIELVRSRNVLLRVIESLNLIEDPEFADATPGLMGRLRAALGLVSSADRMAQLDPAERARRLAMETLRRKLSVARVGTSHTIMVRFKSSDPDRAARIANAVVDAFLQEKASTYEAPHGSAIWLRERLKGLGPNAQVISAAETPIRPDGPRALVIAAAALLFGLIFGAAVALLRDFLDRTVRTAEQAESLVGAECFGVVPKMPRDDGAGEDSRLSMALDDPHGPLAAALQRANAAMSEQSDGRTRVLGVASIVPGEGASMIAVNLARLVASAGKRVLLVDAVFDDPQITRLLTPADHLGLTDLFRHGAALDARGPGAGSAIVVDQRSGMHVLPVGRSQVLGSDAVWAGSMDPFLRSASAAYDLVVIDMPALATSAAARTAAPLLDSLMLVMAWGRTKATTVVHAIDAAGRARAKVLGVVLNDADARAARAYGGRFADTLVRRRAERRDVPLAPADAAASAPAARPRSPANRVQTAA